MAKAIMICLKDMFQRTTTANIHGIIVAMNSIKEKIMFVLAAGVMVAILVAIVGDYVVAGIQTSMTGEPADVSKDVMTLVQTALGGVIGIIGGYFGAKADNKKDN